MNRMRAGCCPWCAIKLKRTGALIVECVCGGSVSELELRDLGVPVENDGPPVEWAPLSPAQVIALAPRGGGG